MKAKKDKKNFSKILVISLSVILLSSMLSIFTPQDNNNLEGINVYVQFIVSETPYSAQNIKVVTNSTVYNLLINGVGGVEFEQDGDINSIGNVQNNFLTGEKWQVLVNNAPVSDYNNFILNEGDYVVLYFGDEIIFFNVTLGVEVGGYYDYSSIRMQEGITILYLINNYNSTVWNNATLDCLFGYCSSENESWSVVLNNETITEYNTVLAADDELIFRFE